MHSVVQAARERAVPAPVPHTAARRGAPKLAQNEARRIIDMAAASCSLLAKRLLRLLDRRVLCLCRLLARLAGHVLRLLARVLQCAAGVVSLLARLQARERVMCDQW